VLHEKVFSDAEVARFVFAGRAFSLEESATFIRENFNFAGDDAHPGNVRSINVILKMGMRHESDARVDGRGPRRVYCLEA